MHVEGVSGEHDRQLSRCLKTLNLKEPNKNPKPVSGEGFKGPGASLNPKPLRVVTRSPSVVPRVL